MNSMTESIVPNSILIDSGVFVMRWKFAFLQACITTSVIAQRSAPRALK